MSQNWFSDFEASRFQTLPRFSDIVSEIQTVICPDFSMTTSSLFKELVFMSLNDLVNAIASFELSCHIESLKFFIMMVSMKS